MYSATANKIRTLISVENIELNMDQAVPCSLIINELLTNAYKYAFPGGTEGTIEVDFHRSLKGEYILSVRDNGIGIPDTIKFETAKSLGLTLVQILTQQLKGTIDCVKENGTSFTIIFPQE